MEVQCFEIATEADSNDITLCSHDDKPSTGMFAVPESHGLVVTLQSDVQFLLSKMSGLTSSRNFCHVAEKKVLFKYFCRTVSQC